LRVSIAAALNNPLAKVPVHGTIFYSLFTRSRYLKDLVGKEKEQGSELTIDTCFLRLT
jgi:hypothetical protein